MWPILLFGLLVASVAGWIFTASAAGAGDSHLERSKEEIQVEETLVFDFLHGLGEAFTETIRPNDLHRLIVEGATRILDAHGGALYLADRTRHETGAGLHFQRLSAAGRCSAAHFAAGRSDARSRWRVIFVFTLLRWARACSVVSGKLEKRFV